MTAPLRISMVIPNYNSGATLERALRSILDQQDPNLQLIIADAGSTDESSEIIDRYRDRLDVVISEKDEGQGDGINKGFRHADGDLHGWLCADDEMLPGSLEHARRLFERDPDIDVITGACERVFPDEKRWVNPGPADPFEVIQIKNVIEQPSTIWRASMHRSVGELDPSFYLAFDWDLWIRMKMAGANLHKTDFVMSRYYFTEDNKSGASGTIHWTEAERLIRKYHPRGARLAAIYGTIYRTFDLKGALDRPPTSSWARRLSYLGFLAAMCVGGQAKWLRHYNWHFASQQQRGLRWW